VTVKWKSQLVQNNPLSRKVQTVVEAHRFLISIITSVVILLVFTVYLFFSKVYVWRYRPIKDMMDVKPNILKWLPGQLPSFKLKRR
jgi:hypothetical protein